MADILLAEDEADIRLGLVATLESEGHSVRAAADGGEAMRMFSAKRPELVILDVMMPVKSGWDVCAEIRRRDESVPVIMLTAKSAEADKVIGLGLGADDYMTKPFGVRELLARVSAALRRARLSNATSADAANAPFRFGSSEVEPIKFLLRPPSGDPVPLSARELALLKMFASHPGDVLSRDFLLDSIWGVTYGGNTRTLDQHVAQLRKKLGGDAAAIETVHGVGYRYAERAD